MRDAQKTRFPLTVFYAFKQSESEDDEDKTTTAVASTGWETMLEGLMRCEFQSLARGRCVANCAPA